MFKQKTIYVENLSLHNCGLWITSAKFYLNLNVSRIDNQNKMQRDTKEVTLKDSIDRLLHAYKLKGKVYEVQVSDIWPTIIGSHIASQTKDIYLRGNVLYIRILSPVVKQELQFMKDKIATRLNDELGAKVISEVILL